MKSVNPEEFLELAKTAPVVDVRSPGEYASGHIPGALNLPLFENDERSIIGILYKNNGRQDAIRKGLEIVAPKMTALLDQAIHLANHQKILVHCWRGGMRSSSVGWLFESAGLDVYVLQGGYKAYRRYIRENILEGKGLIVMGGLTGSGKTLLLKALKEAGEEVVDLEGLANHRGSAFGGVGLSGQPGTEQFENLLYEEFRKVAKEKCVWIEDESRRIGDLFLPDLFHAEMRKAPVIEIQVSDEERKRILIDEYANQPTEDLIAAVAKLRRRVGGLLADQTIEAIDLGDYGKVVDLVLPHYDKRYRFGLNKRNQQTIIPLDLVGLQMDQRLEKLKELRKKLEDDYFSTGHNTNMEASVQ